MIEKYKIKIKIDVEASHQDWIASSEILVERLTGVGVCVHTRCIGQT